MTVAKFKPAIHDNRGNVHKSADDATISDISELLGRVGDGDGLALGIAKSILGHRQALEAIFAEHDLLLEETSKP
jgi:hypothetical protein